MAERRMFAKTIIDSDAFLDMPMSSQLLYFHLAMRADDDGFVNKPKSVMRICGAKDDDLRVLLWEKFLLGFSDGVIVIKHWRIHNYIQKDRYVETKYKEDKALLSFDENNAYTLEEGFLEELTGEEMTDARKRRLMEYKRSDLPYSFSYKIRFAFIGEICPICGRKMGVPIYDDSGLVTLSPKPTIHHNLPISKGGKHELSNISVICAECNLSIQDKPTGSLNNELVVKKWNEIIGNVSIPDTQVRKEIEIDKDSIGEDNKGSDDPLAALDPKVKTAFLSFQQMRKTIKKPMTQRAMERMVAKLKGMSDDPETQAAILQQSEDHCWADVYPLKTEEKKQAGAGMMTHGEQMRQDIAALVAEAERR